MSKKLWISIVTGLAILCGVYLYFHHGGAAGQGGGRPGAAGATVPVVAGRVRQRDTPIYLDGIGTVVAFNTVTVRPQVDGQLQSVVFNEGQEVNAGDVLALIDSRALQAQLDQTKAKQAQDAAQLANAGLDLKRDEELFNRGLLDQQSYATQQALVSQLQAAVQADAAGIENAQVQLGYTRITAPFAGRTGLRLVDQGNIVHASDTTGLVVITQLQPIAVIFTLPQQDLPRIQEKNTVGLPVIALDRDNSTPLDRGAVSVVDNQIDPTTGTIKLKATFPNAKRALWPGQFVNVRLLVETREQGLVVPASVIQRGPQGAYAYVIKADATVEVRPVEVAQIDAGFALIDHGLAPGEQVVVDGQYKLQAGSRVTAAPGQGSGGPGKSGEHRHHKSAE
jgi:multidrug efflux system membrane fusion protein